MHEGVQVWRGRITIAYREDELRAAVGRLQQLASGELAGTMCTVSPAPDGKRSSAPVMRRRYLVCMRGDVADA